MTELADAIDLLAARAQLVSANSQNDTWIVPSPCVSVCKMDAARRYCQGCLRTIDEIRAWSTLDHAAKRAVWQLIEARLP